MNSQNNICINVQENIAWGRALQEADQTHVLNCPSCSSVALGFEEVDSLFKAGAIVVPDGFAENVMRMLDKTESSNLSFLENFKEIINMLINHQWLRWGIGGTSFLIAFAAH
jgi:hypothetical protein